MGDFFYYEKSHNYSWRVMCFIARTSTTTTTTTSTTTTIPDATTTTSTILNTTTTTTNTTTTTIPDEDSDDDDGSDDDSDDDDTKGKLFTFNCEHSMKRGFFGLERLTMNVGDTENCTLKLTNHEPGKTVEVSSLITNWFWSGIKVEPARSITDENGELKITITATSKGTDWAAWAVPNDRGQFLFNLKTYDSGLAWGMFVQVK
ncbi:MAG: hypothetical protein ACUZ8E_11910 [Candidatus Anammoxibacter sp.]